MMATARLEEPHKRPGVHYAWTQDGIELPVVDVTHPAFALNVGEAEQRTLLDGFQRQSAPLNRLPKPLRRGVRSSCTWRASATPRGTGCSGGWAAGSKVLQF